MSNNQQYNVYSAGPMEGLSTTEMKGWRDEFKTLLEPWQVTVKDPTRRLPFRSGEDDMNRARSVFQADLMDIDDCRVVFFDFRKGKGYAWGTAMEAMYAYTKQKPLIIWTNPEDPKHPFLESMATIKVHTLQDGVEAVVSMLDAPKWSVGDRIARGYWKEQNERIAREWEAAQARRIEAGKSPMGASLVTATTLDTSNCTLN